MLDDNNPRQNTQDTDVNASGTKNHQYNSATGDRMGVADNRSKNINSSYIFMHTVVIAMGFLQFGKLLRNCMTRFFQELDLDHGETFSLAFKQCTDGMMTKHKRGVH